MRRISSHRELHPLMILQIWPYALRLLLLAFRQSIHHTTCDPGNKSCIRLEPFPAVLHQAPPLAKRAKAGKVVKKRTVKSSKQLVDEFVDEGVPAAKPSLEDTEEAILQKVLEESLTDAYPTQRGPLPPVVFRETDTGKLQPLPEVPGKGKEKVGEEQAAQVLLHLQTTKKKSPTEQYIFQRHTPVPSEPAGHEESSSLYAELGLSGSDTESDEEMPSVVRSGAQDEGQAGPDPGKLDEGQAGPNPDDVAESQPLPTPSVLAGPNLEHSDVEITDPSSQPQPEHMDEGFIATAYPEVQENLKLTVDEQMIPEEPVSSTGTLSSLQHLTKDFSYGDQFIDDKPSEANYEKTTADTEAESMVSVTIQQDTSVIPPMTSPVIGPVPRPASPNVHWPLPTTTTTTSATTTTLPLPPQPQQGPSDPIIIKRMGELEELIANLVEENQDQEERLDKRGSRINKLETMDLPKMIREQTVEFIDSQEIDRKINESVNVTTEVEQCASFLLVKLVMPPFAPKKFRMGVAIATGRRGYYKPGTRAWVSRISRKIRIPISMYPCRVEERLTIELAEGREVEKIVTTVTKNGVVTRYPGKFQEYQLTDKEKEMERMMIYWDQVEYEVSDDDDSDLKSTARSVPKDYELEDTGDSSGI
ncbi:hypothetical protein Tco_1111193 [Tanacetum coccineum]|uniref:Uncharacterized protein n=1 Tax=Tanacetum coccineum TaxID=301880 RepID=A0ABQ5IKX8_9ASTR